MNELLAGDKADCAMEVWSKFEGQYFLLKVNAPAEGSRFPLALLATSVVFNENHTLDGNHGMSI